MALTGFEPVLQRADAALCYMAKAQWPRPRRRVTPSETALAWALSGAGRINNPRTHGLDSSTALTLLSCAYPDARGALGRRLGSKMPRLDRRLRVRSRAVSSGELE